MMPCFWISENAHLTHPWCKLLLWNWKLGVEMQNNQQMIYLFEMDESSRINNILPLFIKQIYSQKKKFKVPKYVACALALAMQGSTNVTTRPNLVKQVALSWFLWGQYLHVCPICGRYSWTATTRLWLWITWKLRIASMGLSLWQHCCWKYLHSECWIPMKLSCKKKGLSTNYGTLLILRFVIFILTMSKTDCDLKHHT